MTETIEKEYKIYLGKNKESKVSMSIDDFKTLRIPRNLLIGVGNKSNRYMKYLDDCFAKDIETVRSLAYIHKVVKEHGSIALVCKCGKSYHSSVIRDFILDNKDSLDTLATYMFPDASSKDIDTSDIPIDNQAQLPPEELEQVKDIIKEREIEDIDHSLVSN